jgi:nucleoid-associated protein YgaU
MPTVERPEKDATKLKITKVGSDASEPITVSVQFNPTEYSLDRGVSYAEQSLLGLQTPITQFVNGTADSLSMELFFDTYEKNADVRNETKKVTNLLNVDGNLHAPPVVKVEWGKFVEFTGVLESANTRFTLFLGNGTPVRARMDVTFKQYGRPTLESITNPRNSADRTKRRVVIEGETLSLIAAQEYGDPAQWRTIAATNDIDNPRTLAPGRTLTLPPLEE